MIRRFDVCANRETPRRRERPLVVVLQSEHVTALQTTMVAPLLTSGAFPPDGQVNIAVRFESQVYTLAISLMGAVPTAALGAARGSLVELEYEIGRAMDRLFTGF